MNFLALFIYMVFFGLAGLFSGVLLILNKLNKIHLSNRFEEFLIKLSFAGCSALLAGLLFLKYPELAVFVQKTRQFRR